MRPEEMQSADECFADVKRRSMPNSIRPTNVCGGGGQAQTAKQKKGGCMKKKKIPSPDGSENGLEDLDVVFGFS